MTTTLGSTHAMGHVTSADGTTIGFRRTGSGEALILLHGSMQTSRDFLALADALSTSYDVIVPDRRGRGLSGQHGDRYGIEREVEDVRALADATGAARIFGLSSGALVALCSAGEVPQLTRVALYEPPLSIDGSVPIGWLPRFEREVADGKKADALLTSLRGLSTAGWFAKLPRFLIAPALRLVAATGALDDQVPLNELLPTMHYDMQLVKDLADTTQDYAGLEANVLLLGGSKSAEYLRATALDALEAVLSHSSRVELPGLDHTSPAEKRDAPRVGRALLPFFA